MVKNNQSPIQVVLYEGQGARPLEKETLHSVFTTLLDQGYAVTRVAPGQTENAPGGLASLSVDRLLVLGDFGGEAPDLEDASGQTEIVARDVGSAEIGSVGDLVEDFRGDRTMNRPGNPTDPGTWKPWFPVIDYDRCTNCMQCLSFCLFDVYGVDDENRIQVQNNDNCKTNCPACSRVCPEVAIMFPKYTSGPINGEPVSESDLKREKMKVDISSLLGGDIYARLRDRSEAAKSRFSTERSADKALNERKKCLTKLQKDGFIPQEVLESIDLASLPSPDEIQQRATAAAQKADEALAANRDKDPESNP